jgi:hypothetical protein
MNYGYDVKSPYVSADASQSDDSSLVFVSNGDGSGELYPADMKGLPDLSHQLAGIRTDTSPGKYISYDVGGSEESPCSRDEAWKFIEQGYDRPGVVMYQAIKSLPTDIKGIRHAASTWYDIGVSLMKTCQYHGGMDIYLKRSEYDTVIDMIMQGMPMEFLTQYILLNDHHVGKCAFNVIEEG